MGDGHTGDRVLAVNHPAARGLVWGVRESFLAYLTTSPGSQAELDPGSASIPGGQFSFEWDGADEFDLTQPRGVARYRGGVRFTAHFGLLSVAISNPWVHLDGDRGTLSVDGSASTGGSRIALVSFATSTPEQVESGMLWRDCPTALLGEGAMLFNGVYSAGEVFDPLSFAVLTA